MLSFECIKNEKSVYFLLTSATCGLDFGQPPHFAVFAAQRFIQFSEIFILSYKRSFT